MTNNDADQLYDRPTVIQLYRQMGGVQTWGVWTWKGTDVWGHMDGIRGLQI